MAKTTKIKTTLPKSVTNGGIPHMTPGGGIRISDKDRSGGR